MTTPTSPGLSIPDPLIAPLRDAGYLVNQISAITGAPAPEVARRLHDEYCDLGGSVRRAMREQGIEPHTWSDELIRFYDSTDAFLYETTAWNRSVAKNRMRQWVGRCLNETAQGRPLRVLTYGDGLGFDSFYLSEAGHDVDYFDVSRHGAVFARQICEDFGQSIRVLDSEEAVQANQYDAVICLDVLEHVPEPEQTVAFLARALRDGGQLLVHAPFWYVSSAVATHLRSNRRYSGNAGLYVRQGLRPVDGDWFWNPLALVKSGAAKFRSLGAALRVGVGGWLLTIARWWAMPHAWVWRQLYRRQWRPWNELAALAEGTS